MNPDEKSHKRALNVIAAYGAEQSAWPEEERGATLDALQSSDQLKEMLREAASLDRLLQRSARVATLDGAHLAQQIAHRVPQQLTLSQRLSRRLEVVAESLSSDVWKPALAASLTLSAGLAVGSTTYEPVEDWSQAEHYSFTVVGEEY
ncbi:MAG: hypothetical protein L7S57_01480 [Luminiphilus sp.]|jgi:hypothetical protein|nr:hypothetical protein [Luminiphilus sp.]